MTKTHRSARLSSTGALALAASAVAASLAAGVSGEAVAANPPRKMTVYSVATQLQYLNHQDDRSRGAGNNPFGNFKDTTALTKEAGVGPFPGDRSVFTFELFGSPDLHKRVGSATFICEYSYGKNGLCEVAYVLSGGTLLGTGFFNFSASSFTIGIAGGTGAYRGSRGVLVATPGKGRAQLLTFQLT
jgi:hypothetical protein